MIKVSTKCSRVENENIIQKHNVGKIIMKVLVVKELAVDNLFISKHPYVLLISRTVSRKGRMTLTCNSLIYSFIS